MTDKDFENHSMSDIAYRPIGVIHSPFKEPAGMPIQPSGARGALGIIELEPEYEEGLRDLDGFSHLILLYHFHLSQGFSLTVRPFLDDAAHGVFATRAPRRPNPIGLSVVRLEGIEGATLRILDVDVVDGTPLLDVKPYVPEFDSVVGAGIGWLTDRAGRAAGMKSDERFTE